MKLLRHAVLIALLGTLAGCSKCADYRYIVLDAQAGFRVSELRKPEWKGLEGVGAVPMVQRAVRERYVLTASVKPGSYKPAILMTVSPGYRIEPKPINLPPEVNRCFAYNRISPRSISFTWWEGERCESAMSMDLEILDKNLSRISTERIPFQLETSGRYCVVDGP